MQVLVSRLPDKPTVQQVAIAQLVHQMLGAGATEEKVLCANALMTLFNKSELHDASELFHMETVEQEEGE